MKPVTNSYNPYLCGCASNKLAARGLYRAMQHVRCLTIATVGLAGALAFGQTSVPPPAAVPPNAVEQQRNSAAAMQESVAKQQAAIQQQPRQTPTSGFFLLPRPTGLGPVTTLVPSTLVILAPQPPPAAQALPSCDPLPIQEIETLVGKTAQREGLDADLLRSVIKQESAFRPCALSPKGAMGLMQLMPATAEQFGLQDPFNPVSNVDAGARFLRQLLTRYGGDVAKALGAYNAGPSRVDAAGGVPAIPETLEYVRQILASFPIK